VVARRGAGRCGNCTTDVSVSSSLRIPIPLSPEDRKALEGLDWLAEDIGSAAAAGNSLLGLTSNENCLGGDAILLVSSDRGNVSIWAVDCMHTSLLSVDVGFDVGLFEWTPFEVLPVTAALDLALCALLASRFLFTTFQSFRFARYAACDVA
jgi:hypothetical protein